jgi:phage terminase small subunit
MGASTNLKPKQEAFACAYVETGNASEAYRRAYDAGRMKAETVNRKAKECLDNGKITARITALQAQHAKRHDITVDNITAMLREDREKAHGQGQISAAVSATMGLAKLHGLIVDKAKQDVNLSFGAAFEEYVRGAPWGKKAS